jgi:hypothetical protein
MLERFSWVALLQVLVGLGAMIKGPAIVITFVLPAAIYVTATWQWKRIDWTMLIVTSPIAVALSLWWYVYIWFAFPMEQDQLLGRLLNQGDLHVRSWHYYLVKMPIFLGPVALFLPLLWFRWRDANRDEKEGVLGFWLAWFLGNLVIFSFVFSSKQSHYLVPAFPGLALALGLVLAHPTSLGHRINVWFVWFIMAIVMLVPLSVVLLASLEKIAVPNPIVGWVGLVVCCAAVVILALSLRAAQVWFAFRAAWSVWLVMLVILFGHALPLMDKSRSGRDFADRVDQRLPADARIGMLDDDPQFVMYLDAPVVPLADAADALEFIEESTAHYVILYSDELEERFDKCQLTGTEVLLKQAGFMKSHITAYLIHDLPGARCNGDCMESCEGTG